MRSSALAAGLLFASGVTGLVYEVAWARHLGPILGQTADAAAVVVASYFAGLAIGGALGGRLAERLRRPLLGYAVAEALAAAWAILLVPVLDLAGAPAMARALHGSDPLWAATARALVAVVALLPATVALGATIPLVAAHLRTVRGAAWAYAANLAGAVAGTSLATFVLLGALGVTDTGRAAAVVGLAVAALAAVVGRRAPPTAAGSAAAAAAPAPPLPDGERPGLARMLAIVSGAGSAAVQVLFTRALALTFHNSTYTFGAVVTAFLISLAVGAAVAARLDRRGAAAVRAAGRAALAVALLLPLGVIALWASTRGLTYFDTAGQFFGYVASALGLALIVVAPPVTAMAMLLPIAWRLGGDDRHAGATVGRLTAVNNLAGAAASLLTALLIAPRLGLWNTFALVGAVYAATGAWLTIRTGERRALVALAVVAAAATTVVARPVPLQKPGVRLLARWETAYGWLEVVEDRRGERRLRQNIHYGFASSDNDLRQRRMGTLPVLLHPAPRRALFIGLATGITAGAALADPDLERLDVVELIPEVRDAAAYFATWNGGVLADPRARIHTGDARFWLRGSDATWDVIATDLLVPWESHTGYLYAREHYREVARHLAPGGVYVQWLALWQVSEHDLALIADTTRSVFPTVLLWRGDRSRRWGLCAVVASDRPLELDGAALAAHAARLRPPVRHPDPALTAPRRLIDLYLGDWPLRPGAPLNSDDNLRLELDAPKSDRRRLTLIGPRLDDFYRRVVSRLERRGLRYRPASGERPRDVPTGAHGPDGSAATGRPP